MTNLLLKGGSVRLRRRVRGPGRWEFRYWTRGSERERKLKTLVIGTTDEYADEQAVRNKAAELLSRAPEMPRPSDATLNTVIDRYIQEEHLLETNAGRFSAPGALHYSTANAYLALINKHLRPRWGDMRLNAIRPAAVQAWLVGLTLAPKTKAHIRGLLRRLFEKAMLWELLPVQRNPLELVEVKGVSKRRKVPTVLTVEQFHAILAQLSEPYRTMVIIAQCMGLRVSEILGLQWQDIDFDNASISVTRGVVNGRVSPVKTEYSQDVLPLDPVVAGALIDWRNLAPATPDNWLFPNPETLRPYNAWSAQKRHLRETGERLGVRLGWHTFRHTYRSWLDASGATIGVQQKLMRHASIATTMNDYGNALLESKREANSKVVRMALESGCA